MRKVFAIWVVIDLLAKENEFLFDFFSHFMRRRPNNPIFRCVRVMLIIIIPKGINVNILQRTDKKLNWPHKRLFTTHMYVVAWLWL